jgi:SAM-dependent methyltransferase
MPGTRSIPALHGSRGLDAPLETLSGPAIPLEPHGEKMSKSEWGMDEGLWQTVSAPYSPSSEDWALVREACPPELMREDAAPRILVLGVTPALIHAPWPKRSEIHAVDYDQVMIDTFWHDRRGAQCHCAYWQEMPFPDDHFDLVVGDCSFCALHSLGEYDQVIREVVRVMKPDVPLVARFFTQSEPHLTMPELLDDRYSSFRPAARRLLALIAAGNDDGSACHRDTPLRIREQWGNIDDYLVALGQSPAEIERAKTTYEQDMRLNYPTERQVRDKFAPYFSDIRFAYPAYDAGANCPTVRFS